MMAKHDTYQISRDRAQSYFLGFDQEQLIRIWNLCHDENSLYADFLGKPYKICRTTGTVVRLWDRQEAGYEEVLSIFDLLCHDSERKCLSGRFAPVNSLKGRPAIGVGTDFHSEIAAVFDQDQDAFRQACLALGGTPTDLGDIGFSFPVFSDLSVLLKFYGSDEDFPASVVLLWDENMLQYVYYETVFYIAGHLLHSISDQIGRQTCLSET